MYIMENPINCRCDRCGVVQQAIIVFNELETCPVICTICLVETVLGERYPRRQFIEWSESWKGIVRERQKGQG